MYAYIYVYISNCLTASPATMPGLRGHLGCRLGGVGAKIAKMRAKMSKMVKISQSTGYPPFAASRTQLG